MALSSKSVGVPSAIISDALQKALENMYIVLGSSENNSDQNNAQGANDALSKASVAINLTNKDIHSVIRVPAGLRAVFSPQTQSGTRPGMFNSSDYSYTSNTEVSNWPLWVYDGYYWMVLNNRKHSNLSNEVISAKYGFTNTSGLPSTTEDGIVYVCVGPVPDGVYSSGRNYLPWMDSEKSYNEMKQKYTNQKTRAIGICGSGAERRYGTCCLYYSEKYYDSIRGITYEAGDFYRCTCTECYRCAEMADSMGMQYRFNKWKSVDSGPTGGTGEKCMDCDSEDFPSNCGPCSCRIGWTEESYYEDVLSNKDISSQTSQYQAAKFAKVGKLNGGMICSVMIDLEALKTEGSANQLTISDAYKNQDIIYLPIDGDSAAGGEAKIKIIYERNGLTKRLIGFSVENYGYGYSAVEIDSDRILEILPNVNVTLLKKHTTFNVSPPNGFHIDMDKVFNFTTMIDKQVKLSSIKSVTDANTFDFYALVQGDAFIGAAPSEPDEGSVLRLTQKLTISNPSATSSPSTGKGGGMSVSYNQFDATVSQQTSLKTDIIVSSKEGSSASEAVVEIETKRGKSLYGVGKTLQDDSGTWEITSSESPVNFLGEELTVENAIKKVHHKEKTKITVPVDINETQIASIRLFVGTDGTY